MWCQKCFKKQYPEGDWCLGIFIHQDSRQQFFSRGSPKIGKLINNEPMKTGEKIGVFLTSIVTI
jgi:hypothetical protein